MTSAANPLRVALLTWVLYAMATGHLLRRVDDSRLLMMTARREKGSQDGWHSSNAVGADLRRKKAPLPGPEPTKVESRNRFQSRISTRTPPTKDLSFAPVTG